MQPGGRDHLTRRTLLATAAAGAAAASGSAAMAQRAPQPARQKGPLIWLDMDQQDLDDAYDQLVYAPNLDHVLKRLARNSELVRERLGAPKRFAYGPTAIEGLDVFTAKAPNAPVNVFVHGGAWRTGLAKNYHFPAEMFVSAGAHLVVLDFINVIEAGGNLNAMAEQVRRAVAWVYRNAQSFGGDPERLYVSGHSSGGHLTGVLLTTDWQKDFGLPPTVIKGGVAGSGMYDLKPVRLSKRSSYVTFTDEIEQGLSAQRPGQAPRAGGAGPRHPGDAGVPAAEPRFRRRRQGGGQAVTLMVTEGYNHFEVLETLGNPYSMFGRAVLEQMKLSPA